MMATILNALIKRITINSWIFGLVVLGKYQLGKEEVSSEELALSHCAATRYLGQPPTKFHGTLSVCCKCSREILVL